MIAYIKGKIESVIPESVHVEAHGVGYEIICANPFVFQDQIGETTKIYTYHYVREDTQTLYGFKHTDEKMLFAKLLNVSGIGPKGALAIIGSVNVSEFAAAIEQEDDKFLTSFPGVGKKTARQMILDLKGKLPVEYELTDSEQMIESGKETEGMNQAIEEGVEALRSLGYSERELKKVIPTLKKENPSSADDVVRRGLALLLQK